MAEIDSERYIVGGPGPMRCRRSSSLEKQQDARVVAVDIDPTDTERRAVVTLQRGEERPHPLNESSLSQEADWAI